jgi:hypothetical protein
VCVLPVSKEISTLSPTTSFTRFTKLTGNCPPSKRKSLFHFLSPVAILLEYRIPDSSTRNYPLFSGTKLIANGCSIN